MIRVTFNACAAIGDRPKARPKSTTSARGTNEKSDPLTRPRLMKSAASIPAVGASRGSFTDLHIAYERMS